MKYLVIGAGVAGTSAVKELLKFIDADDKITVLTNEAYPFYYRPRLIECLSGEVEVEDIIVNDEEWFADHNIDLHLEEEVIELFPEKKLVKTKKSTYHYDKLLLAHGASCFVPPIPGHNLKNVLTLRTAYDAKNIYSKVETAKKAVVVGGGLLGLESAYNMAKTGLEVNVIEMGEHLLVRQLDEKGGQLLQRKLEEKGINFYTDAQTQEFSGDNEVQKVVLGDGTEIETDFVLLSTGVRSNLALVDGLAIETNRGIIVDNQLRTTVNDIYAAGDVAEHEGRVYGIWPPSMEQGKLAGQNMAGKEVEFTGFLTSHTLKVAGINVVSIGELNESEEFTEEILLNGTTYVKVIKDNDKIIGAIIVGDYEEQNQLIAELRN